MRAAVLLLLSACAADVPSDPSWHADVKPILTANCVRCHGAPAIGGAPPGFRLDRLLGSDEPHERIQGAPEMREFLQLRVADGHGDLLDHQVETLLRWDGGIGVPRPGNQRPVLTVLGTAEPPVTDAILLDYELRDPDFETVSGLLVVGDVVVDRSLHAGRGRAGFSTAAFPESEIRIQAEYTDGAGLWIEDLGRFDTNHDGDLATRVSILAPPRHAILSDRDATTILFEISDLDSPGPFTADVVAIPDPLDAGAEPVEIATGVTVPAGGAAIPWDTSGLPEGETWQVRITVSDGAGGGGGASVDRLIVSHTDSDESFASLADVFERCAACHDGERVAGPDLRVEAEVRAARAAIYQRVVRQRTMPPRSAELEGLAPLSDAERDRLAAWLLSGAL